MKLIVISNPTAIANEGKIVNALFQSGLKCFHIRKPESDIQTVKHLIEEIEPQYHASIALHQFHQLAPFYEMKRLHYIERNRNSLTAAELQSKIDNGFILSTSIHDIAIRRSLSKFDYVFFGPVFNSISKPGYFSKISTDTKLARTNIKPNIIALGGVELSRLQQIKNMGFDGVAVLGTLWNYPNEVLLRFHQLQKSIATNLK